MGQTNSREKSKKDSKKVPVNVPSDSPLGVKLSRWDCDPDTRGKDKRKMLQYCMVERTKAEIRPDRVRWPKYGTFEGRICRALQACVSAKEPSSQEERDYAACWRGEVFPSEVKALKVEGGEEWDPLDHLPPPCLVPPGAQAPPEAPASPLAPDALMPLGAAVPPISPGVPTPLEPLTPSSNPGAPVSPAAPVPPRGMTPPDGPSQNTRSKITSWGGEDFGDGSHRVQKYLLREVPVGGT